MSKEVLKSMGPRDKDGFIVGLDRKKYPSPKFELVLTGLEGKLMYDNSKQAMKEIAPYLDDDRIDVKFDGTPNIRIYVHSEADRKRLLTLSKISIMGKPCEFKS